MFDCVSFARVIRVFAVCLTLCVSACGYIQIVGISPEEDAQVFDGSGNVTVYGSAVDAEGNYYLAGTFVGALTLGDHELSSATLSAYVASFDSNGAPRWSQTWSGDFALAAAVHVRGESVQVTGYVRGSIEGPIPVMTGSRQEGFVFAFDRGSGAPLPPPQTYASVGGNVQGKSIASAGSVTALCGHYIGSVDFGGGPLLSTPPLVDHGFLATFDAAGTLLWARPVEGANILLNTSTLRADGSAVAAGAFRDGSFGGRSAEAQDALVVGFDSAGALEYELGFGSTGADDVRAVTTFEDGVIVVGVSSGDLRIGDEVLSGQGGRDGFIARINGAGDVVWAHVIEGTGGESLLRVRTDDGRIYVAGEFDAELRFGEDTLEAVGGTDVMVLVFDAAGSPSAAVQLGGSGNESIGGFEVSEGRAWVALALDGETVLDDSGPQSGLLGLRALQF